MIFYTIQDTPFGFMLLGVTDKGICVLRFGDQLKSLEKAFLNDYKAAQVMDDEKPLHIWLKPLIAYLSGKAPWPVLPYDIQGTDFQYKVWQYLRTMKSGRTTYYSAIAQHLGQPTASRAVARACASNPVAVVVPCHRVLAKSGQISGYRWGVERKEQLLALEQR